MPRGQARSVASEYAVIRLAAAALVNASGNQIEHREYQDDSDVYYQPRPEVVPEEWNVRTDHDGYQREHVQHYGCLPAHCFVRLCSPEWSKIGEPSARCGLRQSPVSVETSAHAYRARTCPSRPRWQFRGDRSVVISLASTESSACGRRSIRQPQLPKRVFTSRHI